MYNLTELFSGIGAFTKAAKNINDINKKNIINVHLTCDNDFFCSRVYKALHCDEKETKKLDEKINDYCENKYKNKDLKNIFSTYSNFGLKTYENTKNNVNLLVKTKNLGDIKKITETKLKALTKTDILTYSFPCQDISNIAKNRTGFSQELNNRSSLAFEVPRIIQLLQQVHNKKIPILVMENVRAITNSANIKDFDELKNQLNNLGYENHTFEFNGCDFGTPQKRIRIFMISILRDVDITKSQVEELIEKHKPKQKNTLEQIIKIGDNHPQECKRVQKSTKTASRKKIFDNAYFLRDKNGQYKSYARTITTKQDRQPNAGLIFIDDENFRYLTPREQFLLFGYQNEDYEKVKNLNISYTSQMRLIGNSIIIPIAESVLQACIDILETQKSD